VIVMTVNQVHDVTQVHDVSQEAAGVPGRWPTAPNPGDLSRRLMSRRAELRLSVDQVAVRAHVEPRYLEFLERYPGHPSAATLRRLAAALRTTPAALLGADQEAAPDFDEHAAGRQAGKAERLTLAESLRLLAARKIGRIAFNTASGLLVLPVNYTLVAGTIVLRTGSGSVIAGHSDGAVTFEADNFDMDLGQGWSVLVRGEAHRVMQPAELHNLRERRDLEPWPAGEHDLFVRIVPAQISGRRVRCQ
jgi:transcriptional regulator with XRE-family HTH domain